MQEDFRKQGIHKIRIERPKNAEVFQPGMHHVW